MNQGILWQNLNVDTTMLMFEDLNLKFQIILMKINIMIEDIKEFVNQTQSILVMLTQI